MIQTRRDQTKTASVTTEEAVAAFVVTYRRPALLRATLSGIAAQTRPPDSVVVMNNDPDGDIREGLGEEFRTAAVVDLAENVGSAGGFARALYIAGRQGAVWSWLLDDDAAPARLPRGGRQVERDRQRENPERVIQIGRRKLATERPPPGAHMERPERHLEGPVGVEGEDAQHLRGRTGRGRLTHPTSQRAAWDVAANDDIAVALHARGTIAGDRRDLDFPAGLGQAAGDAQAPGIGRGGVGHQEDGPAARCAGPRRAGHVGRLGRCRRCRIGCRRDRVHQRRPVSRVYSSSRAWTCNSQL